MKSYLALLVLALPVTAMAQTASGSDATDTAPSASSSQIQRYQEQKQARNDSLAELKQQLINAPVETRRAQRDLSRLKQSALQNPAARLARQPIATLEEQLSKLVSQVADWQKALTEANSMVIAAQNRPQRAQAEISSNQTRLTQIATLLTDGREDGRPLTAERRNLLGAEQDYLEATNELRRQELAGNTQLLDLGKSRRDLLTEQIARAEQETQALQTLINDKRRAESEQTIAELQESDLDSQATVLVDERQQNLKLSDYLLQGTDRLNALNQRNLETRQQLEQVNQTERMLEDQISVLEGSQVLSRLLRQQRQALPQVEIDSTLKTDIADYRIYQFELNQMLDKVRDPQTYINELLQKNPETTDSPEIRRILTSMLDTRADLLSRLESVLASLLSEATTLQLNQHQLQTKVGSVRSTIEEHMFWTPSNKPVSLGWFENLPQQLTNQAMSLPWKPVLLQLWAGLQENPQFFIPLGLLILVLLWRRNAINRRLDGMSKNVGHIYKDSQLYTPLAFLLNLLLALPGTMGLAICGYILQMDGRGQNVSLGSAFYEMAQAWLVFYTAYRMLAPGRMAEQHFRRSSAEVKFLRRGVVRLALLVLVIVGVVTFAIHQPASLADDVIGILVLIPGYALLTASMLHLMLTGPRGENTLPLRRTIGILVSLVPLGLIVAVGLGYYYTALRLTGRLVDTLYLLMIWLALEAILVRSLSVAARRLAYKRIQEKRQAQAEESSGGADGIEIKTDPRHDLEQINQQSLRLTRLALYGTFFIALYWVWADLISVVSYLDNFTLYESGSGDTLNLISLRDVLSALLILVVTVALARNLPGLLEVTVLSRMKLAQGSAYATSTLLSYVMIGTGISSALSALGVAWDQLQWLAAALSVGLGFGLQEIFGNFVSGLIILFERPVRIGDVITIGSLSGKVTRIRIRATTITDFDRKEIIVPNKTFITDQLINWTLSDTITRVTLMIGVAYGSDLRKVREIMLEAATSNPRALKDPAPEVFFLNFGESTLDHELRIHVKELGDRIPATDEILRYIDEAFNRLGISIAFRQVDVHIKNLQNGQQLHLGSDEVSPQLPAPGTP